METNFLRFLTLTISLLVLIIAVITPSTNSATARPNDTSYVRRACDKSQYSAECFKSLSPYSARIKSRPVRLCKYAARAALDDARAAKSDSAAIAKTDGLTKAERAVAKDCRENIDDTADELRRCYEALDGAEGLPAGKRRRDLMDSARTWASAALTDDSTCTDAMDEMKVGPAGMGRFRKSVQKSAKSISVLLAIMNAYCSS